MTEHQLYEQVARYIQLQYPGTEYRFDLAADLKLTPGQAIKHKRLHPVRGYPDLFIAEPNRKYHGLFIEIKKDGTRIKKRSGEWASSHIAEQAERLEALWSKGYQTCFAVGFDEVKKAIDDYMANSE